MALRKKVIIKLTNEQKREIKEALGKDVSFIILQLIGGSQLIVDASDDSNADDRRG